MISLRAWTIVLAPAFAAACSDESTNADASVGADRRVVTVADARTGSPDATSARDAAPGMDDAAPGMDDASAPADGGTPPSDGGAGRPDAMIAADAGMMGTTFSDFVHDLILNRTNATGAPVAIPGNLIDNEDQADYADLF